MLVKAEYSKSSRAKCKTCWSKIEKESLRLAVLVQSKNFDGKVPIWFHFDCFWKKGQVSKPEEIHGFYSLRWEDQQKIRDRANGAGSGGGDDVDGESASAAASEFQIEYSQNKRCACRACFGKINKLKEIKICKKVKKDPRFGPSSMWYHLECFAQKRQELNFSVDVKTVPGFTSLNKSDQVDVIKTLKKPNKRKSEGDDGSDSKKIKVDSEMTEEEENLKEQSTEVWKLRDQLKELPIQSMKDMLEFNDQGVPTGTSNILEAVSDCMVFGALGRCLECKTGQFYYTNDGYKCSGHITAWTRCTNFVKTPTRKPFKIPAELKNDIRFKKYKYKPRTRIFPTSSSAVSTKPLHHMKFVIAQTTDTQKLKLTHQINCLGGVVAKDIDNMVAACISTKTQVNKMTKLIKQAKEHDVHVVDEVFLKDLKPDNVVSKILKHSLAPWGSDPQNRIDANKAKGVPKKGAKPSSKSRFTKNIPTKQKMTMKGGSAVDPDSKLGDVVHVIEDDKDVFSVVLGVVDITSGHNSYYKLQALEKDGGGSWWLFKSWGRVGTTVGGSNCKPKANKQIAIDQFKIVYKDKTGNDWSARDTFVKHPNKFYPLDIDYGQDDENIANLDASRNGSKLPKSVQDVVCAIFDIDQMKAALVEFEIDMKKMPLGKLSKKQIESAYSVLTELNGLIETKALV